MKSLFVGNITLDILDNKIRVGGPGFYGGKTLSEYLNVDTYVLTYIDEKYKGLVLDVLSSYGIKILGIKSDKMPIFIIKDGKVLEFRGHSYKISNEVIENYVNTLRPDIMILSPIMREIDKSVVEVFNGYRGSVTSLDIQGFVRLLVNGKIGCEWSKELEYIFPYFNIIHGNILEFCFTKDEKAIVKYILDISKSCKTAFVISLDYRGTYSIYNSEIYYIPSLAVNVIDDVGAGDILLSVASYFRAMGLSVLEAIVRGVIAASLKVENTYKSWFDKETLNTLSQKHIKNVKVISI